MYTCIHNVCFLMFTREKSVLILVYIYIYCHLYDFSYYINREGVSSLGMLRQLPTQS